MNSGEFPEKITVINASPALRLDQYLARQIPVLSRSRIQHLIKSGEILLNGSPAKAKSTVANGDTISVNVPEEKSGELIPQDLPIHILHEDEDVIVLNKQSGMVVHPAAGNEDGTLVNALLHHCGSLPSLGMPDRPGIVHRLDKDTSGAMVVAKNDAAHANLSAQFADRTTQKIYLAVVQGKPRETHGTIFTNMGRHPVNRMKRAVLNPGSGKPAITDWEVIHHDAANNTTLVLCTLHTGRTHQIRVHMQHLGHPIIGDPIYAHPSRQSTQPGRLMLHAWKLGFDHPVTGRRIELEAPIPGEYHPWMEQFRAE